MTLKQWQESLETDGILPIITQLRRELHRQPELGGCEEKTAAFIRNYFARFSNCEEKQFDDCYGLMYTMRNGEGKCVAVRADMDALPLVEKSGVPFASEIDGVMHSCGHDAHMAIAMGTAAWLDAHRDRWQGTVKFLFEPAEETYGGGQTMVEQGCLQNPRVDCVIGQHVNPSYAAGTFFSKPGYVSGSSDELFVTIRGKRSHGAYPEGGVDAIVIAAQVVSALQSLVSRNISPFDPAVITFGEIRGGTANNIICDEVLLHGTLRTLSRETREKLQNRIRETACGVSCAMGGSAEIDIRPGYGAVYNHDGYHAAVEAQARAILGEDMLVRRGQPSLGVESFCYFVQDTPGVYYDLGCGVGTALHTDTFNVDEACLLPGIALQCASVLKLLEEA